MVINIGVFYPIHGSGYKKLPYHNVSNLFLKCRFLFVFFQWHGIWNQIHQTPQQHLTNLEIVLVSVGIITHPRCKSNSIAIKD